MLIYSIATDYNHALVVLHWPPARSAFYEDLAIVHPATAVPKQPPILLWAGLAVIFGVAGAATTLISEDPDASDMPQTTASMARRPVVLAKVAVAPRELPASVLKANRAGVANPPEPAQPVPPAPRAPAAVMQVPAPVPQLKPAPGKVRGPTLAKSMAVPRSEKAVRTSAAPMGASPKTAHVQKAKAPVMRVSPPVPQSTPEPSKVRSSAVLARSTEAPRSKKTVRPVASDGETVWLTVDDKVTVTVKVGDVAPGGGKVTEITGSSVSIFKNGETQILNVE